MALGLHGLVHDGWSMSDLLSPLCTCPSLSLPSSLPPSLALSLSLSVSLSLSLCSASLVCVCMSVHARVFAPVCTSAIVVVLDIALLSACVLWLDTCILRLSLCYHYAESFRFGHLAADSPCA